MMTARTRYCHHRAHTSWRPGASAPGHGHVCAAHCATEGGMPVRHLAATLVVVVVVVVAAVVVAAAAAVVLVVMKMHQ